MPIQQHTDTSSAVMKFVDDAFLCLLTFLMCFQSPRTQISLFFELVTANECIYGGALGLCWNDNFSTTHICKYLLMSKSYSEVAAYLLLFYRLLLSDVDCGVELRCYVVTMPLVGRERWWTTGYTVGWPEVRGGVEVAATGAATGCPDERWCAWSTRLRGRAVGSSELTSAFLICAVSYSFRWSDGFFYTGHCWSTCSAIGWLEELMGVASRR